MDLLELFTKFGLIMFCTFPLVYVYAEAEKNPEGKLTESMYSLGLLISMMAGLILFFHYIQKLINYIIKPDDFWWRTILSCLIVIVIFFVIFTINMTIKKLKIKDEIIVEKSQKIAKLENEIYSLKNK